MGRLLLVYAWCKSSHAFETMQAQAGYMIVRIICSVEVLLDAAHEAAWDHPGTAASVLVVICSYQAHK